MDEQKVGQEKGRFHHSYLMTKKKNLYWPCSSPCLQYAFLHLVASQVGRDTKPLDQIPHNSSVDSFVFRHWATRMKCFGVETVKRSPNRKSPIYLEQLTVLFKVHNLFAFTFRANWFSHLKTHCSSFWYNFLLYFFHFIIFSKPQRHSVAPDVSFKCTAV